MNRKRIIINITVALALIVIAGIIIFGANRYVISTEQIISLGEKYLSELNYEQALVQFLRVIEIDPMNPRGYIGAAESYIGLGQTDKAVEVLREGLGKLPNNEDIQQMLDGLLPKSDSIEESEIETELNEKTEYANVIQGEYINEASGFMRYKYTLVNGIPQPMGIEEADGPNGIITETVMAYMSGRDSENEEWSDWEVSPHYWAGLRCTDCGEIPADGSMPSWFRSGFSHPWSGEWEGDPRIFYKDDSFTDDVVKGD